MTGSQAKVAVLGMGQTGLSVVDYLQAKGIKPLVLDTRAQPAGLVDLRRRYPDLEVVAGELDSALLEGLQQLIVSPGVAVAHPFVQQAVQQGIEVLGDIELFAREVKKPVIAITGSNGKSTVTALAHHVLNAVGVTASMGGNIGVPALQLLEHSADVYILELSSFQLETTSSLKPMSAVVLNISADHMDRYDSVDAYADAKWKIYQQAELCVMNLDDERVRQQGADCAHQRYFSLQGIGERTWSCQQENNHVNVYYANKFYMQLPVMKLQGKHNLANVLAVLALLEPLELDRDALAGALADFQGLSHRMQLVGDYEGVRWIDDSKGTNAGASIAALNGLDEPVVLIAGGQAKGQEFSEFAAHICAHVKHLILIGEDAGKIASALPEDFPLVYAIDMRSAVSLAKQVAVAGDVVLLSPACASFDMFKDYRHRGDVFAATVKELCQ